MYFTDYDKTYRNKEFVVSLNIKEIFYSLLLFTFLEKTKLLLVLHTLNKFLFDKFHVSRKDLLPVKLDLSFKKCISVTGSWRSPEDVKILLL